MNNKRHEPLIQVKNFSFGYELDKEPVVKNLTMTIHQAESVLLLGPSGSGKSTLSLCFNGLYPEVVEGWSKGEILYNGNRLRDCKKGDVKREIGVVFQDPESQFCMVTVENELAFTLENIQTPREEVAGKIDDILHDVGLINEKQRPIHELSGGQKQKVALASVLLLEPKLLILDEPTANLDPSSRLEFIALIDSLKREREFSLLIIEHQLDDWIALTDQVIAIDKHGNLLLEGTPQDVFYNQAKRLKDEGIHIPKIVQTVFDTVGETTKIIDGPLSERDLATWLYEKGKTISLPKEKMIEKTKDTPEVLSMQGVSYSRGKQSILKDIDLSIKNGELVAIVGQNGAGKSTLLQLMAGLLTPTCGARTFLGKKYEAWSEQEMREELGFVFQNPEHQFITDTVYDELGFGMKLNHVNSDQIEQKILQLLNRFHLINHKWDNPFALSGGQKRRLSVATMLDETPSILLFDEPTFGQDAQTTDELMRMITSLQHQGTAIVIVTHDMDLVDRYCEKVYVASEGEISFCGSPNQLWESPTIVRDAKLRLPYRVRMNQLLANVSEKDSVEKEVLVHASVH